MPITRSKMNPTGSSYRVLLLRVGNHTEEEKNRFCREVSDRFRIPSPLLKKIVDHCPILIKKNLTWEKALSLSRSLKDRGAHLSIERRQTSPPVYLEFQNPGSPLLSLESCVVRRHPTGIWSTIGRARNIFSEPLSDIWVLAQWFNIQGEFQSFEEAPLALNPLPSGEVSPFRVILEGEGSMGNLLIAFKNAAGAPLSVSDQRPKQEWTKVEWDEGEDAVLSIEIREPFQEPTPAAPASSQGGRDAMVSEPIESPPMPSPEEPSQELNLSLENLRNILSIDRSDPSQYPALSASDERGPLESQTLFTQSGESDVPAAAPLPPNGFPSGEGSGEHLQNLSETGESNPGISRYPWMDLFRLAIQRYPREFPNPFTSWFQVQEGKKSFLDPYHSLLTLLVHARFEQQGDTGKALENTEHVFPLLSHPEISLQEIPRIEGTMGFSEERWRDLFHRAYPKLQQISRGILEKKDWKASDLERLIQVVPHMSEKMSRSALRWIRELMPENVHIDFSNHPVRIDPNLYRVAARLGIVEPRSDLRPDGNDLILQAFAKQAFPDRPSEIEPPMTWVGRNEEGGHCIPSLPRCKGCLFEDFCPKRYPHFDPSEKGMGQTEPSKP